MDGTTHRRTILCSRRVLYRVVSRGGLFAIARHTDTKSDPRTDCINTTRHTYACTNWISVFGGCVQRHGGGFLCRHGFHNISTDDTRLWSSRLSSGIVDGRVGTFFPTIWWKGRLYFVLRLCLVPTAGNVHCFPPEVMPPLLVIICRS